MSTAVMPQSASYDFGEYLFKSASGRNTSHGITDPLQLGAVGAAPNLTSRQLHSALSRVSSSPTATLVSLLDDCYHRRLERTQSAPVSAAAAAAVAQAAAVNTSRYKTELCRPFEESGSCKYGDKCQFAHGVGELRSLARHPKYKTELCRTYHTVGFCPYGPRCHFVHNQEEARQHNRAVAALLAARVPRQRPPALSPTLSLGSSESSSSSLSQSPTSSLGSFFSNESEPLTPPAISPRSHHTSSPSPPPQLPEYEWRLPVFNRLAANVLGLGDLVL